LEEGSLPAFIGLWWVHAIFVAGAAWLFMRGRVRRSSAIVNTGTL